MRQPLPNLVVVPRPEDPASVAFRDRTALLRATLARSNIALDATEETIDTCETPTEGCIRCDVATGMDGIDPDLIDRIAIAIALYPPKVVDASVIAHVALCRRLRYHGKLADADDSPQGVADPNTRRLMVSVEPFVGKDPGTYSIEQIVHHELFHLFDFKLIGEDPEWVELQPPGFQYRDPARRGIRPTGFVNGYSTTNEREDRASVFEFLMSHSDRLCEVAKTDPVVAEKTKVVWRRMSAVGGDAFLRRQAPCIDWVEIGPRPAKPTFRMRAATRP